MQTKRRKHVDWEIYSSMYDGKVNKKSGILVVNLPGTTNFFQTAHSGEQAKIYPEVTSWTSENMSRAEYEHELPYMPDRIIDNLVTPNVRISVVPWVKIEEDADRLKFLVDAAYKDRGQCQYDLTRPMRRRNS